jgi:tRNA 2-thiouridine synthesizing protein A
VSDVLDLKGLKCPLPALFAKRALSRAAPGTTITVIADDPLAHIDIPHMCRDAKFEVLSSEREGDVVRLVLRKSALP